MINAAHIFCLTHGLARTTIVGEIEMGGDSENVANLVTFQTTLATFFKSLATSLYRVCPNLI